MESTVFVAAGGSCPRGKRGMVCVPKEDTHTHTHIAFPLKINLKLTACISYCLCAATMHMDCRSRKDNSDCCREVRLYYKEVQLTKTLVLDLDSIVCTCPSPSSSIGRDRIAPLADITAKRAPVLSAGPGMSMVQ